MTKPRLSPADAVVIKRLVAERSLKAFIKQAWHVVEPTTPYMEGRHIDAIAEHLEAVTRGDIRNLIINIPPRSTKSLLVSVFWMTWTWIAFPASRWIYASYAQSLSVRDSLKCRRILESEWFQRNWGHQFQLTTDQNTKTRFENDKTGHRIATSVGGAVTGEGADFVVADDPHNVQESESAIVLEGVTRWWDEVMSSRLNDPKTGRKVVVMQRVNGKDLTGHLLGKGDYEHLCLPMRFEDDRRSKTVLGWSDWRTTDGELLWPERVDNESVTSLERALGSYGAAGQLQQRPAPRGGGFFQRRWFKMEREAPADCEWIRFWDLASTAASVSQDPDYTAGLLLGLKEGVWYIKNVRRARVTPKEVESMIQQTAMEDGFNVPIAMEQEPGASGVNTIDHYARTVLTGFTFYGRKDLGNKETRAQPVSAAAEAGNIRIIIGSWNHDFLDELEVFPHGAHDDQVDVLTGAFECLRNQRWKTTIVTLTGH